MGKTARSLVIAAVGTHNPAMSALARVNANRQEQATKREAIQGFLAFIIGACMAFVGECVDFNEGWERWQDDKRAHGIPVADDQLASPIGRILDECASLSRQKNYLTKNPDGTNTYVDSGFHLDSDYYDETDENLAETYDHTWCVMQVSDLCLDDESAKVISAPIHAIGGARAIFNHAINDQRTARFNVWVTLRVELPDASGRNRLVVVEPSHVTRDTLDAIIADLLARESAESHAPVIDPSRVKVFSRYGGAKNTGGWIAWSVARDRAKRFLANVSPILANVDSLNESKKALRIEFADASMSAVERKRYRTRYRALLTTLAEQEQAAIDASNVREPERTAVASAKVRQEKAIVMPDTMPTQKEWKRRKPMLVTPIASDRVIVCQNGDTIVPEATKLSTRVNPESKLGDRETIRVSVRGDKRNKAIDKNRAIEHALPKGITGPTFGHDLLQGMWKGVASANGAYVASIVEHVQALAWVAC